MIEKFAYKELRNGFKKTTRHFTDKVRTGFYDLLKPNVSNDLLENSAGLNYLLEATIIGAGAGFFIGMGGPFLNYLFQPELNGVTTALNYIESYRGETIGATTVLVTAIFAYPLIFHR